MARKFNTKKNTIKKKSKPRATKKKIKSAQSPSHSDAPAEVLKVIAKSEDLVGGYSNLAIIKHSQREFILDFLLRLDDSNRLVSRIITNPHHAKAIHKALGQNIENYEKEHGPINED